MQSAYRAAHSTETALLRICSDILDSLDRKDVVLLVLLDLSAAFDTIDSRRLLDTLHRDLAVTGSALDWYSSYLHGRTQMVKINDCLSKPFDLL